MRPTAFPAFAVPLRPSRLLRQLVGVSLLLAVWAGAHAFESAGLAGYAVLAMAAAGLALRSLQPGGRGAASGLAVDARGELWLEEAGCACQVVRLPGGLVSPWLTVLRLQTGECRRLLVLLPDSASSDSLRQLRVYLDWYRPRAVAAPKQPRHSDCDELPARNA